MTVLKRYLDQKRPRLPRRALGLACALRVSAGKRLSGGLFRAAITLPMLVLGFVGVPLSADPASTLQTLIIVDQGDFLNFQWSFYYVDFPKKFILKEKQSKVISLDDPATLYENISDIVSVAFDLKINGQSIPPDKIARLTISPNKVCTVTMIYRGQPGGRMELRAPVLQYLPPIAMINYEILGLGRTNNIITGNLMGNQGPFPQVIIYQEVARGGPSIPALESASFALFKSELRTAWINSNWVLLSVILLVAYEPPKALLPLLVMTAGWVAICVVYAIGNIRFPWTIPEIILCLPTVLLGVLAARSPQSWRGVVLLACGAGFFNACYDLQQIRWTPEDESGSALTGLCSGFVCGILALIFILVVLLQECKKNREFRTTWAPGICWFAAGLALLLPLQKILFR